MKKYSVLDFETGGLNPKDDALVSVGIVVLDENFNQVDEYYTIIFEPNKIINAEALQVNGITHDEIKNGKPILDVLADIRRITAGTIFVNHNSAFDIAWLNERGFNISESVDTMDLAWARWPGQKAKLGIVCERLGIPVENAHNSLADAKMTAKILVKFSEMPVLKIEPKLIRFDRWKK